ncbi:gliding motility-associated C-terminal domain-containing protein [Flavobacterium sp. N2270]|uniref:T9SS type B sorting domain-containing protein n=1 Tax=Flavobacterium sp. N2270 TaxID=2986831 RepID=UPI002224EB98|nr:fibronectin type III domain-containing protein [Flavobacterium sp. N2270]
MKKLLLFFMSLFTFFSYGQLSEGFEGATFPPTGWTTFDNGIGTTRSWTTTTATGLGWVYAGGKAAIINKEDVTSGIAEDWMVTPLVTVPTDGQLRFFARSIANGEQGSIYKVKISTASQNNPADFTTTLVTYTELDIINAPFEQKVIPLTAYANQSIYIAFVMENDNGDAWIVDNVNVDQACTVVPTALTVTPLSTSATLNWTYTGPATQFAIEYGPAGFVQGTGTVVSPVTRPYNLTGLSPLTNYTYYVRALCGTDNSSAWSGGMNFTTTALPPVCGGNFVDSGGASGNYSNSENITTTICPTNAGELVTVTFTSFNIENNWDFLRIYDGNSTAAPLLGTYTGTNMPPAFTSSAANGCLTFNFTSDGSVTGVGWTSNVTCAPVPTCPKPTALTMTAIIATTANVGWTETGSATQWEVIWLPAGSPAPTAGSVGVTTSLNPYTITGLNSQTTYDVYVRAICTPTTDLSLWSTKATFTTQPFYCAGDHFYDQGGATGNYSNSQTNVTTTICPDNAGEVVTVIFNTFGLESCCDSLRIYDGPTSASPLVGTYAGTALPPQYTATSASGCLTFVFNSDSSVTGIGWDATIICSPPPPCRQPTALTVTGITSTEATLSWTDTNTGVSNWQIVVQPAGSGYPTGASTIINASSNPFTVTGLNPNTPYEFYVLSDCGSTDGLSFWSGPRTFNTLFPGCSGSSPAGNDCPTAAPVCNLDGYCGNTSNTYTVNTWSQLTTAFCGSIENNSFLTFQATATSITMDVNVGNCTNGSGIQFYVFTAATCGSGPVTSINCFSPMNPGVNALSFTGLTIGQTYYLMIDGYAGAVCDYSVTVTSGGSTSTDVELTPVNPTICINETVNLTATGGNGIYNWTPNTGLSATTGSTVTFTPPAPGVYTVNVQSTDTNSLCATSDFVEITVLDLVTPTFNAIAPFCENTTAPTLPNTSTNGITGTWLPALVDNVNSGVYTFTPDAGQCAIPIDVSITVNAETVPSFISPAPICSGDTAPVLSNTSNNGIIGSWLPALVDNMTSGTYTFTPDAGQCASTVTLNVQVLATCTFGTIASAVLLDDCNTTANGEFFNTTSGSQTIGSAMNVFPNSDLGTYVQASGNLIFNGAELRTFKTATSNVCSARLNYRVYEASSAPGAFTVVNLPLLEECTTGTYPTGGASCSSGDQRWQEVSSAIDLTTNTPGNYIIEVYYDVTGDNDDPTQCDDSLVLDNGGLYYSATFSIQSAPSFVSVNPSTCNGTEGSITVSGFTPGDTYGVSYTQDTAPVGPINYTANVNGDIIISNLPAGDYTGFNFTINGCTINDAIAITLVDPVYNPTFTQVGPFCVGDVITLPTTSIEGFTGSWSPAVDNTQTTTYTFMPDAGQCATVFTPYTVVVNPAPSVTNVTSNTPICVGEDAVFTVTGSANTTLSYIIGTGATQTIPIDASGIVTITVTAPAVGNVVLNLSDIDNGACNTALTNSSTVVVRALPTVTSLTAVNPSICLGSDAEFTITGTPNATVTYTIGTATAQTVDLDATGSATITVPNPTTDVVVLLSNINDGTCNNTLTNTITIVVNSVPVPTIDITSLPTCADQTATFEVLSPLNMQLNTASDLFISEVTDAATGALTYVEVYNGTGATVNLSNYKLKVYTNGNAAPSCDLVLSGTLSNNDVVVIKLSTSANTGGVTPDLSFTTCGGVNNNDQIALSNSTDVILDVWGINGTVFTPGVGYTYRRLTTATLPSVTWDPADWSLLDPEDYSDVGFYTLYVTDYEYILSNGTSTTTQTSVDFTGVTPGTYTLIVHDLITGCFSEPYTFTIDPFVFTNPVLTFTYVSPVCISSTSNPLPDTSVTGFNTGGTFAGNNSNIVINPSTGEVDLSSSFPGTYTITYTFAQDATNCINSGTSQYELVINSEEVPTFNDVEVCVGSNFQLPLQSLEGYSGTWSPAVADVSVLGSTTYFFTPNNASCSQVGELVVFVESCTIPKGVSPNGDGLNDSWDLSGFDVKKVEIFNRYGKEVYSKSNYTNEWVGKSNNGNELPDGTYYYVIQFNDMASRTGWVYINREQ